MSWLADIAGKAEDFLNKIDKNAATALSITNSKPEKDSRQRKLEPFLEPNNESSQNDNHTVSIVAPSGQPPVTLSRANEKEQVKAGSSSSNGATSFDSRRSTSSKRLSSGKQFQNATEKPSSSSKVKNSSVSSSVVQNGIDKTKNSKGVTVISNSPSTQVDDTTNEEDLIAYLNSSESSGLNESVILKQEVESQAKELKLMTKNHRSLQKDHDELKQKLEIYKDKLIKAESSKQTTEVEEQDLRKLLEVKETEIRDLSSRHQQALEALQKLELSQENVQKLEQCVLENSQLKSENDSLVQRTELLACQSKTAEDHVLSLKTTLSSMEKEFANYKEKAKSILNYKDELIASLKNDDGAASTNVAPSNTAEELVAEVTALKNERELVQADLSQTRAVVDSLKEDNVRLEKEISTLRYFTEDLGMQLKREKETVSQLQSENLQVCQQLQSVQFELEREKSERKRLDELVTQYKRTSISSSANDSRVDNGSVGAMNDKEIQKLKTRVAALSQSLYEKQSLINDISTDKQLLQIEVERLRNELKECRVEGSDFIHGSGLPQTVIASQPLYLSESPWDSRVSAKMKRMYTQLDAVFCQFGLALRKRPNLRFGMSLYVVFLHLWVFFVLFSWMHHATPEENKK